MCFEDEKGKYSKEISAVSVNELPSIQFKNKWVCYAGCFLVEGCLAPLGLPHLPAILGSGNSPGGEVSVSMVLFLFKKNKIT